MSEKKTNVAASELKVVNISVDDFRFSKGKMFSESVFSNGFTHVEYDDSAKQWSGSVYITIRTGLDEQSENENCHKLIIVMHGDYSLQGNNTCEEKDSFQYLLRNTCAFNVLTAMRGIVLASTSVLGSIPGYIIPFWNLNKYKWDDDPVEKKE